MRKFALKRNNAITQRANSGVICSKLIVLGNAQIIHEAESADCACSTRECDIFSLNLRQIDRNILKIIKG